MLFENMTLCLAVGFLVLLVTSVIDIKTREVPDWISYATITFALGYAAMLSLYHGTWGFIVNSIAGLALGVAIGLLMFYTGQWGGGDSKLIMGVSALIGLSIPGVSKIYSNYEIFIFLINTVLVGAVYGLLYSIYKAFLNFRACKEEAKRRLAHPRMKYMRLGLLALLVGTLAYQVASGSVASLLAFSLAVLVAALFYIGVLLSSVEKVCMIKSIDVSRLTEGDWLATDVEKNGKTLIKTSKIGLTREEISKIKRNNVKSVIVKEGIPFVPSFLAAYVITFVFTNWLISLV